jgi:N utilization substance protein A
MEDLAEQSIDELTVIDGIDETLAGELIMTARAPWFADETPSDDNAITEDTAAKTESNV